MLSNIINVNPDGVEIHDITSWNVPYFKTCFPNWENNLALMAEEKAVKSVMTRKFTDLTYNSDVGMVVASYGRMIIGLGVATLVPSVLTSRKVLCDIGFNRSFDSEESRARLTTALRQAAQDRWNVRPSQIVISA